LLIKLSRSCCCCTPRFCLCSRLSLWPTAVGQK